PTVVTVAPAAVCSPNTVDLTASAITTGSDSGLTYTYFTDAAATIAYTTPSTATAGTYYIKGTNANGCSSIASVVVTVNVIPTPTGSANQSFCTSANITQLVATGTAIKWYDAPTGGNFLPNITAIGLTNGTTYYASQTINGCESTGRLAVTVTINPLLTPSFTQVAPICSGATLAALPTTSSNGVTGTWLPAINNTATTTYTFTPDAGQCATTATMTITVNTLASTPTGNATQAFSVVSLNDATINNLVVNPTSVIWYPTLADAQAGTNPIASGTVISNGSTYYAVNVAGGCPSLPFAVTVTVTLSNNEFNLNNFVAYPNPVIDVLNISYSSEITNVNLHNMLGQVVISKNINTKEAQIDLSNLEAGTYFVNVTANDTIHTFKVIKK
ncbi:MAG: T9SS type A sorting domain-containing protein, partial [Dolichospermum sp.]